MSRWRSVVAVAMTAGVVAGCSSSASERPDEPAPSTPAKQTHKDSASDSVKGGTDAAESLGDFRCEPDESGRWRVSGTLTNDERDDADFRVTVVVAPEGTPSATARQIIVPDVPSGDSTKFSSKRLPATEGDGSVCSVQVARLR